MKKFAKILVRIFVVVLVLIAAVVLLLLWLQKQPAVRARYWEKITLGAALEKKYTGKGSYAVLSMEREANNEKTGRFIIWYPAKEHASGEKYPAVIMVNGTGVPASKYEAVFEHLASWGFVVIGNEDESSWDGSSSDESLAFVLQLNEDEESILFDKIDVENIGIAGHSQGGVGAINAVTVHGNQDAYKALYTASTTQISFSEALHWPYDVSKVSVPYFMTAGTKQIDAGNEKDSGITPLFSLRENYAAISDRVMKIHARRVNADHGDMLSWADGYMTAWFLYLLKDDQEAGKVFLGENAEILKNENWQDIEKNL
ncbi:MAG: alpha/beta hydrolase [Fusicatenibacter sp.]|nr:alpha/beta hydrolase [Fusicatenibacter sp.]